MRSIFRTINSEQYSMIYLITNDDNFNTYIFFQIRRFYSEVVELKINNITNCTIKWNKSKHKKKNNTREINTGIKIIHIFVFTRNKQRSTSERYIFPLIRK